MNFIKSVKSLLYILPIALFMTGCTGKDASLKNIEKVCSGIFTYPEENAGHLLAETNTDDFQQLLEELYSDSFTEDGFQQFCNKRIPLNVITAAQNKSCEITVESIEKTKASTDTDNTTKYIVTLSLNGEKTEQEILVTFEKDKIDYFDFADNSLIDEIESLK